MTTELPESILVVRLGAIGDVVNALVLATAIRDAAPRTRIGWAVHPLAFPLVEGHPAVDRVHLWPRGAGLAGWRMVRDEVRAARYDLAVDLQRILKSSLLARASGAPRVLGYDRGRAKELSWLLTRERLPAGNRRAHMVDQVLEFAAWLGIREPRARHVLPDDPAAAAWARERRAELGAAPVLINLGASKPQNRWEPSRFGALAAICREELGAPVVFTGGRDDRPAAEVAVAAAGGAVTDLVGASGLRELYHLMDHAQLFVGCDTGPMHLAVARRLPVVALFGPADPARTGPYGPGHRVVRAAPLPADGSFTPTTMRELTVEQVRDAILDRSLDAACKGKRN